MVSKQRAVDFAITGSPLPISSLRLLVSPLQLVSGAIWQTVQQKVVSDYGMLEEFISTVTDIVPELLMSEQRTQLILGLRARLVLELCRCEETANLKLIQPHLDRMEGLTASWIMEDSSTNAELSNSNFRDLIQNMLKNPEEMENFFQNVFPEEFGPRYDEALCTLTWHFLSRLEKLLPLQTLQQVAFMLKDVPSALEESMKIVSYPRELQTLLGCQKELCQLDESGCSLDGAHITSALSLHSIDIIKLDEEEAHSEKMAVENVTQEAKGVTRCQEKDCTVLLERLDDSCLQRRPVRPNRGLKMKMILLQEKKGRRKNPSQKMAASLPCIQSLPSGIDTTDTTPDGTSDEESVDSLKHPSYVAPVGRSSEDSLSDCSEDHSLMAPIDDKDLLVTFKEQRATQMKHAAANKTKISQRRGLCCICKVRVKTDMKAHMKTHFPDGVFACPRCDTRFKALTSLRLHLKRVCFDEQQLAPGEAEVAQSLYKCDECEKAFRYKLSLDKHKRTHNQLYCDICRRVLRDAETLARHKVSHTPFQCTLCEENFPIFKRLTRHYENVHQLSRPFKCHHCPKVFTKLRFYIRHEWKHTGQLPFQCPQCSMKFRQDTDLVSHQRVHTREKPFLCADCGRAFSCSSNLKRHINFIHSEFRDARRFSCTQCNKTFKEKGALLKHEQRKHLKQRTRHPCMYCGKMFSQSGMTTHTMIHTGERPFKCTVPDCDKCFRSTSEVKNHVMRQHSMERPFTCNTCGKGFIREGILALHMKIHTGEKPHVCFICGKAFLKIYSMNRHIQLLHKAQ